MGHFATDSSMHAHFQITVSLPELRGRNASGDGAQLNKDHNLEWTLKLAAAGCPGDSRELMIKYTIEYPINETITYKQI
jgi:hypothetical protein